MTKYILLESVVPVTYDGGFRQDGYRVVDSIEIDKKLDIPSQVLDRLLSKNLKSSDNPKPSYSGIPARKVAVVSKSKEAEA